MRELSNTESMVRDLVGVIADTSGLSLFNAMGNIKKALDDYDMYLKRTAFTPLPGPSQRDIAMAEYHLKADEGLVDDTKIEWPMGPTRRAHAAAAQGVNNV